MYSTNYVQNYQETEPNKVKKVFTRNVNPQKPPITPTNKHGQARAEIETMREDGQLYDFEEMFADQANAFNELLGLLATLHPEVLGLEKVKKWVDRQHQAAQIFKNHGFATQQEVDGLKDLLDSFTV